MKNNQIGPHPEYEHSARLVDALLNNPETSADLKNQVERSLAIVDEALSKYGLAQLALSFNGGKDCLVMLILILAQMHRKFGHSSDTQLGVLDSVYVKVADPFPQVDEFVADCERKYPLHTFADHLPMKGALTNYLNKNPQVKAIYVGIRRADPYGESLKYIQRTDHGWPDFIRIHPVLEWTYSQIWEFLLLTGVKYCNLYDAGYTSLGGITTTVRNPELLNEDGTYKPAHALKDASKERVGRFSATTK